MIDPGKALLLFGFAVAVTAIFLLPKYGLYPRWKHARRGMQRVAIEDALKHIFNCEYKNITCTTESIAGALLISTDKSAELLTRLSSMGLLVTNDIGVKLTPDGNSYALRIIRVHRLWESYLADETSVPSTEWHASAELAEHTLTPEEAESLAAQIGNPHFDPHGDPIPTPTGELPPKKGRSMLSLNSGEYAVITHIEDEPEAVFAQLVAQGLYVGMQVMMIERSNERVRFAADGEEIVLAPILTNNLTVAPITEEEHRITSPLSPLSSLGIGEEATVLSISKAMRGYQRRRLMDLGVVPGTTIRAEMQSASGDPTAYNIRGALVALRQQHADMIFIQK
ncbi:MAG: metal-dependent transcriptional regulator [Bacteroidetes bacterium]|nr:metal-dependent transcriptional regulator [Bacteroidota bacterium]